MELNDLVERLTNEVHTLGKELSAEKQVRQNEVKAIGRSNQWTRAALAAVVVVAMFVIWNRQNQVHRICDVGQQNRDVLAAVVDVAYTSTGGTGGLDLTKLPHYADLSPETKAWVDDFQRLISLGSNQPVPGDANGNRVPDEIERILKAKVAC